MRERFIVNVAVFNIDVGEQLVDGCRMEQSDVDLIPHDLLEVVPQAAADDVINASCTSTLDKCPILLIQKLKLEQRRNALRQMYMDAVVGRFLNRTRSSFDAAVVISADFYPLHNVNVVVG